MRNIALVSALVLLAAAPASAQIGDGDQHWAARAAGHQGGRASATEVDAAIAAYQRAIAQYPNDLEPRWKLLRAIRFKGAYVASTNADKKTIYAMGKKAGEEAVAIIDRQLAAKGLRSVTKATEKEVADASRGIPGLRRAQAAYYARRFGVKLDPEREIVATLGSKEGFANVAQAIIAPGDVVLVPNPSYPIHQFGFLMAGGVIRSVPSEPTPSFFEALERAVIHSIPKPIAVVVCYPANPTAYVASLEFYRDLIAFARKHGLFILSDLAYAEVYFEDDPPPSVLQVPGALEVTVEFTSLSKT